MLFYDFEDGFLDCFGVGVEDGGVQSVGAVSVEFVREAREVGVAKPGKGADDCFEIYAYHAFASGVAGVADVRGVSIECGEAIGRAVHALEAGIVAV